MRNGYENSSMRQKVSTDKATLPAFASEPDDAGHFGPYGGTYASETLMHALEELKTASFRWRGDREFMERLDADLAHYVGRPSPIYFARRLTEAAFRMALPSERFWMRCAAHSARISVQGMPHTFSV